MISLNSVYVTETPKNPENTEVCDFSTPQNGEFPVRRTLFEMATPDDPTRGRRYAGWLKIGERRYGLKCVGFTDSGACALPAPRAKKRPKSLRKSADAGTVPPPVDQAKKQ